MGRPGQSGSFAASHCRKGAYPGAAESVPGPHVVHDFRATTRHGCPDALGAGAYAPRSCSSSIPFAISLTSKPHRALLVDPGIVVVTRNVTGVTDSPGLGNCRGAVKFFFFFFFFFYRYIVTCNSLALSQGAVLAHPGSGVRLVLRAHLAVTAVVQQQPAAVNLLDSPSIVVFGAAVGIGVAQDFDRALAFVGGDPGYMSETADARPHDALGVRLAEHRDPDQPRGVVFEPDRRARDGAVDLDETVRHRRHPIRRYQPAQVLP